MSVFHNNVLAGASGATSEAAAFQIDRSLRFNSIDDTYLYFDPSGHGNRKVFTFSFWCKRSKLGAVQQVLYVRHAAGATGRILFDSSDRLYVKSEASGTQGEKLTTAKFRDTSAWQHFVVKWDAVNQNCDIYHNGVEITDFDTNTEPSNIDHYFGGDYAHYIGGWVDTSNFDGYLAEIHNVNGSALDASSFGEFDSNGVWQPKEYSGSYGTNGFYLKFADNSSASNLGTDSSGNSNTWTVYNLSVASGSGNDSLIDTPTNYTPDSGNPGGNYCVLNPLASDTTLLNGNLESDGGSGWKFGIGTIAFPKSGKWYFEVEATAYSGNFGIAKLLSSSQNNATIRDSSESTAVWYAFDGKVWSRYSGQGSTTSVQTGLATFNNGDIVGFGVNVDDEEVKFYVNGSLQYTYSLPTQIAADLTAGKLFPIVDTVSGANAICNFGQRPFAISSVPTDHLSLCTTNLPDPTIADGSTAFDVALWNGDGNATKTVTTSFSPDFVWAKSRTVTSNHQLSDVVRGNGKVVFSNTTGAEGDYSTFGGGGISSLGTNQFVISQGSSTNDNLNKNNSTGVAWYWDGGTSTVSNTDGSITSSVRANASAGFSVVTASPTNAYTNYTFGHGLNATPEFIIGKNRAQASQWDVYHQDVGTGKLFRLNQTSAVSTATANQDSYYPTAPTNSVFGFVANGATNNYVWYCFAPVAGYSAFGSYEGNGNADGPFVYTGFRPAFIMVKGSSGTGHWFIADTTRGTFNVVDEVLRANVSNAELDSDYFDLLSNGFKVRNTVGGVNASGETFVVAAFAEHPFKTARAR